MSFVLYHPVVKTPSPWEGGRVYTRGAYDEDGDGYWSGSWKFRRTIVAARVFGANPVEMYLNIGEATWFDTKAQKRKGRRRFCSVVLTWEQRSVVLARFRAKTLDFAREFANALIYTDALRELYREVYAAKNTTCVYDASGNPVVTFFGGSRSSEIYKLPGHSVYYTVSPDGRMRRINMMYCGYSSTGITADSDDFVKPGGVVFAQKPWNGATVPDRKQIG